MLPMDWSNKLEHASGSTVAHDTEIVSAEYGRPFPVERCFHAWTASADTPLQETRHILRKAHIAVRGRRTRPPFGASQHLITSPPGHPREERTWVDGVKGGAPLGLAALSENASPAQRGPRRVKTKMKKRRSSRAAKGGSVVVVVVVKLMRVVVRCCG